MKNNQLWTVEQQESDLIPEVQKIVGSVDQNLNNISSFLATKIFIRWCTQ